MLGEHKCLGNRL